jgi:hypothetical protein
MAEQNSPWWYFSGAQGSVGLNPLPMSPVVETHDRLVARVVQAMGIPFLLLEPSHTIGNHRPIDLPPLTGSIELDRR